MRCNDVMNNFLKLDNNRVIPFSIRLHIFFCKKCRNEIFSLKNNFDSVKNSVPFNVDIDITEQVMKKVCELELGYEKNISSFKWLFAGLFIIMGIVMIPYSSNITWAKNQFGNNIEIPLSIVMGIFITIYSSLYIGTHMEEMKKISDSVLDYYKKRL